MKATSVQDTGLFARLIGIDELIGKAELRTKIQAGLFLGQEGVRSGFRHNLANPMRDDLSSPGGSGFKDRAAEGQASFCRLLLK
jgi:hypothetical protein